MGELGDAVSYTVLALGFVVLIFVGAFIFVQASRRGSRRLKWSRDPRAESPAQREATRLKR
jgi:hypothetical protein